MFIYKLLFSDGSMYVGKTTRAIDSRYKEHCSRLHKGTHHSYKVQNKYKEFGIPKVEILEEVGISSIDNREVYWIAKLDTYYSGLNCSKGGETTKVGEDHIAAKYKNDDYMAVVYCLAYTNWSLREVAEELNVGYEMVKHLYSGRTNKFLSKEIPEVYSIMCKKRDKIPEVVDSNGTSYPVPSIKIFIEKFDLNGSSFNHLLNKKIKTYKGWALVEA